MPKTAFITGANRGIGKAISLRLAEMGYQLFLMARDETALASVASECRLKGVEVASLAGELSDESYMDSAVTAASDTFGAVDVLVNNAGFGIMQSVQEADVKIWRDIMDVNFNAVVYLCRAIVPGMIERKSGAVINISSISGRNSSAGSAIYSASKHALNGFSGCLYEDVRDHGIKVSTLMPGFVETNLTSGMGMDAGKMIRPEDVADSVAFVLESSPSCCPTEIVLRPQLRP